MATLVDILRKRQFNLEQSFAKGELTDMSRYARDFACINQDCGVSPVAVYADSASCLDTKSTNDREMISWWTISTPAMDREGDVLEPMGCIPEIGPFCANPIVDFDHRKYYPLPVGKSIGDGILPVIATEKSVRAGCKHHSETQFSDEVWRLVSKGLLNGCSVAFIPVVGERLNKSHGGDSAKVTPRYRFKRWQITAWSIAPVGINPEGLRSEISRGGIKSESLVKSLSPFAQKPASWSPGYNFEDQAMNFNKIDKEAIGAIRFHKSKFDKAEDCLIWLKDKSLDDSLLTVNEKSFDFSQTADELGEKTDKVDQGVYVVYKAFPPKKKEEKDADGEAEKKKKPTPKPAVGAGNNKPDPKQQAGNPDTPDPEDNSEDEDQETKDFDTPTEEGQDHPEMTDDKSVQEKPLSLTAQNPNSVPDSQINSTPSYAGQALIDVLKHKAAECRFYEQSLASHDHDGLKALMQKEQQSCKASYDNWLNEAKAMFPNINFEQAAALEDDDFDDDGSGLEDNNDALENDSGEPADKAPSGLESNNMGGTDLFNEEDEEKKKKLFKSLSDDDWDAIAIHAALTI